MENRTILFQGKEIDVDDEPGENALTFPRSPHLLGGGGSPLSGMGSSYGIVLAVYLAIKAWRR